MIINKQEIKITQLSDDTTYFLKDHASLSEALQLFKKIGIWPGYELMPTKQLPRF